MLLRRWAPVLAACLFATIGCTITTDELTATSAAHGATPTPAPVPDPEPIADPLGASLRDMLPDPTTGMPLDDSSIVARNAPTINTTATLRIYTHGAYRVEGVEDVKYIFEPNGDVLQIKVGNIFAGASHYLTWNIGPEGYAEVLRGTRGLEALVSRLEADRSALAPAVGEGGRHLVWMSSEGALVHELLGIDVDEQLLTTEQQQVRTAAHALLAELDELSQPQGKTRTPPTEWVPPHVTIEVRAEYDTRYYNTDNFPWPFEASLALVRDLAEGDELTLCLQAADAELAWELFMVDDVNHVRLPIEVNGLDGSVLLREAGLTIAYPLYNPSGSACPDVASINPPS